MSLPEQYRPPGRSNRSGRTQDNDVFEGLPVKQWGQSFSRVSLAPPVSEVARGKDDRWGEPPMPRDFQLLHPYTQHILRLARSGKVVSKRKSDHDLEDEKPEDDHSEETKTNNPDERGYMAKKWKPVPENQLEPEHKHFEFLAKRRKGMPNFYGAEQQNGAPVPLRKIKVRKADSNGEVAVYDVLVPEGHTIEGEVTETTELAEITPVVAIPGTVIEGVGIANDEGVVVAEHLKPAAVPRRNRPPPKKKGGPGRGKKRVTFTNPDGSTYTTVVPNATKIVPQPGQTVKHVAKGEEATADVSAAEAAASTTIHDDGDEEGSGSEDGEEESDDDDEDDDDHEEGELSQNEDAAMHTAVAPVPSAIINPVLDVPIVQAKEAAPADVSSDSGEVHKSRADDPAMPPPVGIASMNDGVPISPEAGRTETSHIEPEMTTRVVSPSAARPQKTPVALEVHELTEISDVGVHSSANPEIADLEPESIQNFAAPNTIRTSAVIKTLSDTIPDTVEIREETIVAQPVELEATSSSIETVEVPDAQSRPHAVDKSEKLDDVEDDLLGNLEKHIQGDKPEA